MKVISNLELAAQLKELIAEAQRRALLRETYKRNADVIVNTVQRSAELIEAHKKAAV